MGIEPASVATIAPLSDRLGVAYSTTVRYKIIKNLSVTAVLVSNTEVLHNYQFLFWFMSPIQCQLETQ